MSPKIHPEFWTDPSLEAFDFQTKGIFLWLITNPATKAIGAGILSPKRFTFETGLAFSEFERACEALHVQVLISRNEYFIRNYIFHQFGRGKQLTANNIYKSMVKQLALVKNEEIKAEILKNYPEFESHFPANQEGLTKPKEKEKEKDKEKENISTKVQGGAPPAQTPAELFTPEPEPNPPKVQEKEPKTEGIEQARAVLKFLNDSAGRNFRDTENNLKLIVCRLAEVSFDVPGVQLMISRQVQRWGNDPKMTEYLRPETLFGKQKFGGYYDNRELPISTGNGSGKNQLKEELKSKTL